MLQKAVVTTSIGIEGIMHNDGIDVLIANSADEFVNSIKKLIDAFSDTTASIYFCPSFFEFDLLSARWDDVFHPGFVRYEAEWLRRSTIGPSPRRHQTAG